jgi:hypothetical protein
VGEGRTRLLVLCAALAVSGLSAGALQSQASALAASVTRTPAPDLLSAVGSVRPGVGGSLIATALVVVASIGLAWQRRVPMEKGFPGAKFTLPPRLAVAPGIYGIRFGALCCRGGARSIALVRSHVVVAGIVAWGGAAVAAARLLR